MTREEQVKEYCASQGFPYGACSGMSSINAQVATDAIKWADKTMVDKACEWLFRNTRFTENDINDFRRAMKE